MDMFIIVQQMLMLLAMMLLGFIIYKLNWVDGKSCASISKIVINICNPCLTVYGVLGKGASLEGGMLFQTLLLVAIYYGTLTLVSLPIGHALRLQKKHFNLYRLMTIFSNIGFMGIPVVTSIYGKESMLLIAFYNLGYSLLLYTYGVYLAGGGSEKAQKAGLWKKLVNPGVVGCLAAIAIFVTNMQTPDSVGTFMGYVGNAAVPLSMMLIGTSVAEGGKKEFFLDVKMYLFSFVKLLAIPIAAAFVMRLVPWPPMVEGVFILMMAMPVGSMAVMLASESGADALECTKGIILTTLLSVFTIPIVSVFLTF